MTVSVDETSKNAQTNDPKIKLVYWASLGVLVFTSFIGLIFDEEWQDSDSGIGVISRSVKGATKTTYTFGKREKTPDEWNNQATRVYDALSLLIPETESDAIFLTTMMTPHWQQKSSEFCEDPSKPCNSDIECREDLHESFLGQDLYVCYRGYCLIRGWCPVELPKSTERVMDHMMTQMVIQVDSTMIFADFKAVRDNAQSDKNIWTLGEILDEVGMNADEDKDWQKIATKGAVLLMSLNYECVAVSPICTPSVGFERIDNGEGFSWTYAVLSPNSMIGKYDLPPLRNTFALTGIRIVISSHGNMLKPSYTGLTLAIGALLSVFGAATALADFFLLNIHDNRSDFVLQKYRFDSDERMYRRVRSDIRKHLTNLGYY